MASTAEKSVRVFKTAWFAKAARKAHIYDDELCAAILQVAQGQADDLGGGVYKKRLRKTNIARSFLPGSEHFGFMNTCLPNRTGRTLMKMNWSNFASW